MVYGISRYPSEQPYIFGRAIAQFDLSVSNEITHYVVPSVDIFFETGC
jgi:siroheme synthase